MLTPNDIETVDFKKVALGYSCEEVDNFLDKVIEEFEKLFKDNARLQNKLNSQDEKIKYYKQLEDTIRSAILRAEKNVEETKHNAEVEAAQIVKAAEQKAKDIIFEADQKKLKLESDIIKLKTEYESTKAKIKLMLESEVRLLDSLESELEQAETEK
jgi:cell division initiation protein